MNASNKPKKIQTSLSLDGISYSAFVRVFSGWTQVMLPKERFCLAERGVFTYSQNVRRAKRLWVAPESFKLWVWGINNSTT